MLRRSLPIGKKFSRAKDNADLIVDMAFASEEPYERWWGVEILDCTPTSVRLDRLNDGAPLLFNHNPNDLRGTHVPASVRCDDDKVLRGKVRITAVTQIGRDTIGLVETEVLTKASVGYRIYTVIEQTTSKSGAKRSRQIDGTTFERLLEANSQRDGHQGRGDAQAFRRALDETVGATDRASDDEVVYRVMDWEPHEDSLVTIPADNTVGIGRMAERQTATQPTTVTQVAVRNQVPQPAAPAAKKGAHMGQEQNAAAGAVAEADPTVEPQTRTVTSQAAQIHAQQQGSNAVEQENMRQRAIAFFAEANNIDANIRQQWISGGVSIEQVGSDILRIVKSRGEKNPQSVAKLGLNEAETSKYSMFRAIKAIYDNNWNNAGYELECSREIATKLNRLPDAKRFFVPFEVQHRQIPMTGRRDLTAGTGSAGGFLVGTANMSFIEVLRNRSVAYRMGARRLSGLVGNVTIPRQTGAATAVWLSTEASTLTESQQVFGQMALTPKTVGAYTEISRQLLLQSSPDAESIVTADLGAVAALGLDAGVLKGTGSGGEPTGIINTAGIGSVSGTNLAYAGVIEFQTDVATANVVPVAGGYVTTPAVAGLLMGRQRFASTDTPLREGNVWEGQVAGFPAMSSNQMNAGSKLFGDWAQVIVAEWGVLEIEVNPYANFQAGIIGVRAMVSADVGLRYPAAFSLATSIT